MVHKSKSNFSFCLLFLSKTQRDAITALYAFCRKIDDIADESTQNEVAAQQLDWWQEEVYRIYQGSPQHPISLALHPFIDTYQWPQVLFEEMIAGMRMDLNHHGYETFEALQQYCYRAASTVGLLACRIFSYQENSTLEYAEKLGLALQLINIIRDVGEDARRQRVYLPTDILAQHNLTQNDILKNDFSPTSLQSVLAHFTKHAEEIFNQALTALPACDKKPQLPGLIMGNIYFHLLKAIKNHHYAVYDKKMRLSLFKKFWVALQTAHVVKKNTKKIFVLP